MTLNNKYTPGANTDLDMRLATSGDSQNGQPGLRQNVDTRENPVAADTDVTETDSSAADEEHSVDVDGDEAEEEKAPDGGWGWVIVLGIFLLRIITGGLLRSRGVLFIKFKDRFHGTATSTALLTSLNACLRLGMGPVVSILTNRIQTRLLMAFGVILFTASHVISAYAPSQQLLYFSYSVLGGVGRAFILTPIPILLGSYFDKRRSRAFALASTGVSIGGFALTPCIELLFQTYSYEGAFIIMGGLSFQILVFVTLFRPVHLHRKITAKSRIRHQTREVVLEKGQNSSRTQDDVISPVMSKSKRGGNVTNTKHGGNTVSNDIPKDSEQSQSLLNRKSKQTRHDRRTHREQRNNKADNKRAKKKLIDLTILKDVRYLCYVFATACFSLSTPGLFLPSLAVDQGLTEIQAASLLSVSAGFDAISKVISGFVLDMKLFRNIRPEIFNGITCCQIVTIALYPSMRTFVQFFIICAVHGSLVGAKHAQRFVILMDMVGVSKLASSMAVTMTVQGIAIFIGPAISGLLVDVYGTYSGAYYFGACAVLLGACIMAFGQIRNHRMDKAANKQKGPGSESELEATLSKQ